MKTRLTFALLLTVFVFFSFTACNDKPKAMPLEYFSGDGFYSGFDDIPASYTADNTINDGCLVIDIETEPNEHGVDIEKSRRTAGYEHWSYFLSLSEKGENTFLRVAFFIDGIGYYHDLYYRDGKYFMYDYNEYGVSGGLAFRYLRKLDGVVGPSHNRTESTYYVLTDSKELTHHDVMWSYLSSSLSTITDIPPFVWLSFMIYFQ